MPGVDSAIQSVRRSLKRRGFPETVRLPGSRLRSLADGADRDDGFNREALEFDDLHGADTSGVITLDKLDIDSDDVAQGVQYQASQPEILPEAIERLGVDHSRFTFCDIGCGKSITLIVASEYPFKAVAGVEFSGDLCEV